MVKKGDTLIEVCIAIGIFSLIAIGVASVMSSGTAGSQTALESTLARAEIDAQADALRFVHESYISGKNASDDTDADNTNNYSQLWKKIINLANENAESSVTEYAPTSCSSIYDSNLLSEQRAFVLNTRELSNPNEALVSATSSKDTFTETTTYPRLIFGNSNNNTGGGDLIDSTNPSSPNVLNKIYRAEGVYIVGVKDPGSTQMIVDGTTATRVAAYYDFYIRSCWYGTDADRPTTISTVIRLYDPPTTEAAAPTTATNTFKVSYATEPDISWPDKPEDSNLVVVGKSKNYTIEGQDPTKDGYDFVGYNICSFNEESDYGTQLSNCKPSTIDEKISIANREIKAGSTINLVAKGEVTNVIIYPVFLQIVTVSARIDDTTKNPNEYGSISLKCQRYSACQNGKANAKSASISVPVGDTVTATANEGRGYKFVNWSGDDETYIEDKTWEFDVASDVAITASFSLEVEKLTDIRVLNVYPNEGNSLKGWMSSFGKGKIKVTSVPIKTFNLEYSGFKDYDMIVFGFWDCNGSIDLSEKAATWVMKRYLYKGKPLLFGHDTIIYGSDTCKHDNFSQFAKYAGFNTKSQFYSEWTSGPHSKGTTVVINTNSIFVKYPWNIGKIKTKLTIPYSHTVQQYVTNNKNIYLKFNKIDNDLGNFYLTVNDEYNVAMIQTGHSNGQATDDEQKIIANVIFYMYSVYYKKTY